MIWSFALLACGSSEEPLPVAVLTPSDFEIRVAAHGALEARESTLVATPAFSTSQTVGWIVEEGVRVKAGDPVVEFDTTDLVRSLEGGRAGLETARTRIVQRRAALVLEEASALASISRVDIDLRMSKLRITDSESVSAIDREDARVAVERAEIALGTAHTALETLRLQARADIELLELEVADQEHRLTEFETQLEQATVHAPTDGLAIPYRRVGSVCWPGSRLVSLPDLSTMQVVAWVPEVDAPLVHIGQAATVVLDAYPDAPLAGTVTKVADLAIVPPSDDDDDDEQEGGAEPSKQLRLVIALERPAGDERVKLKPGMTVRADLLVVDRPAALSVPIQAVEHDAGGSFVRVGGLAGWSRQAVQLGPENALRVVVEGGLVAGQTVALADPAAWDAGLRPAAVP
jgi:HlyD family secretion protein